MTTHVELLFAAIWFLAIVALAIVGWHDSGSKANSRGILAARFGVLATFMIGATTFGLGILKGQRDAAEQAEGTRKMVSEIRRVLGKMESIRVSFRVSLPARNTGLSRYGSFLIDQTGACFTPMSDSSQAGARVALVSPACYPRLEENPVAYSVLSVADLCLDFFKEPIDPKSLEPCGVGSGPRPDLSMKIFSGFGEGFDLGYDQTRKIFVLEALNRESKSRTWKGNTSITSVVDLEGTQLFVSFVNLSQGSQAFGDVYRAAEIDSLSLDSGVPRIDLALSDQTMTRGVDKSGMPFYYTYLYLNASNGEIAASKARVYP